MARTRHQTGWIEQRGKAWRGHFYEYVIDETGKEKRAHRNIDMGLVADKGKRQAEKELQAKLLTGVTSSASPEMKGKTTVAYFVEHEYLPLHANWSPATLDSFNGYWNAHLKRKFGALALADITRLMVQTYLNELAKQGYSRHGVTSIKKHIVSILLAAEEADYIRKNPCKKCVIPSACKEQVKKTISEADYLWFIETLDDDVRDLCIFLIAGFCALRPSEQFAIRWRDYNGETIMIQSRVYKGKVAGATKTKESKAPVYVPVLVRTYLDAWKAKSPNPQPDDYVFSGYATKDHRKLHHKPLKHHNWLNRTIRPLALERVGFNLTFQIMRRSAATLAQQYGNMKDIQTLCRHARLSTTGEIYVQQIPASVAQMGDDFAGSVFKNPSNRPKPTLVKKIG